MSSLYLCYTIFPAPAQCVAPVPGWRVRRVAPRTGGGQEHVHDQHPQGPHSSGPLSFINCH